MAVDKQTVESPPKTKTEMILKGPMYSVLWMISLPLILNNLIMTVYNMADAYFVGQIGTTEFAAVSFVNPVMFLFQSIGMGVQIAGSLHRKFHGRRRSLWGFIHHLSETDFHRSSTPNNLHGIYVYYECPRQYESFNGG